MPKDKKLDEFIREAFHEKLQQTPPPLSALEAWERIQKRRHKEKVDLKKRDFSRKTWAVAASIILALAATMMIWSPQSGSAFTRWTDLFHNVQGSVIQIFGKVGEGNEAKNAPPSDELFQVIEGSEQIPEHMSLSEAQEVTSFPIQIPKVVPNDFQLKNVTVMRMQSGEEKSTDITLNYSGLQRGGFTIKEMATGEQFGFGSVVDRDDTKVETVQIHDQKGTLLLFKNGQSKLIWITPSHFYSIDGDLTREEIIEIARSM